MESGSLHGPVSSTSTGLDNGVRFMNSSRFLLRIGIGIIFSVVFNYTIRPRLVMNATKKMFAESCQNKRSCLDALNVEVNRCISTIFPRKISQCMFKINARVSCNVSEECLSAVDKYMDPCYAVTVPKSRSAPDQNEIKLLLACLNERAGQNIFVVPTQ